MLNKLNINPDVVKVAKIITIRLVVPVAATAIAVVVANKLEKKAEKN